MRIRMVADRTGPRWDGRAWPGIGGEIDVDDNEGAAVCGAGWAVPVAAPDGPVETPEQPLEAATEARTGERPGPAAPKSAWIEYAVAQGYDHDEAAAMTKADLMAALGQDA